MRHHPLKESVCETVVARMSQAIDDRPYESIESESSVIYENKKELTDRSSPAKLPKIEIQMVSDYDPIVFMLDHA